MVTEGYVLNSPGIDTSTWEQPDIMGEAALWIVDHGNRYHGRVVTIGTQLQVADTGILAVTNQRAAFLGSRKTVDMPYAKLDLLARALTAAQRFDDGRLTLSWLSTADFAETGSVESYSEGVIDHLRSVEGTKVAALARDLLGEDSASTSTGRKKVSLRATDGEVDVSVIARAGGGGGHRQAAGFATEMSEEELVAFLRKQLAEQL